MALTWGMDTVERVGRVTLTASGRPWPWADGNRDAIARHWQIASAANPDFFNGVIHLIDAIATDPDHVRARLLRTDFQSYLYWRDEGFPKAAGVLDGFGSALIRSSEGQIILGRQRTWNINSGLAYPPGGFIDARDASVGGAIDIAASVAREVREETGLEDRDLHAEAGFLVTRAGAHVSFAVPYRSTRSASALKACIEGHIAADPNPELAEVVIVRRASDMDGLAMPHFARVLLTQVFKDR